MYTFRWSCKLWKLYIASVASSITKVDRSQFLSDSIMRYKFVLLNYVHVYYIILIIITVYNVIYVNRIEHRQKVITKGLTFLFLSSDIKSLHYFKLFYCINVYCHCWFFLDRWHDIQHTHSSNKPPLNVQLSVLTTTCIFLYTSNLVIPGMRINYSNVLYYVHKFVHTYILLSHIMCCHRNHCYIFRVINSILWAEKN